MEPYWSQEFDIVLSGVNKHLVELYKYSEKSIVLKTTPEFGKGFSKYFKELDSRFNKNLTINDEKISGWLFKTSTECIESLNKLLKGIYEGDIKPTFSGIFPPDISKSSKNNKIFNLITKLAELIPEEEEEFILSDDEKCKTTIYYNLDEDSDTVIEGELVYSLILGKKKISINQLLY